MPVKTGDHIGGIRTLEDFRGRCVVDDITGCWHLRTPYGRQLPTTATAYVWLYGEGLVTALRAACKLRLGYYPPAGKVAWRSCTSYDCVFHVRCGTRAEHGAFLAKVGRMRPKAEHLRRVRVANAARSKLTPELVQWALESPQPAAAAAHGLGVGRSTVTKIRSGEKWRPRVAASAFQWRAAA